MSAIGRAGLLVGAPLRVPKFKGDQGLNFLDIPAGHLKRKAPIAFEFEAAKPVLVFREEELQPGDLSETAGAEAKAEA